MIRNHDNGPLDNIGDYKNGKREGVWVFYYENGQLWEAGNFKKDKREGPCVSYFDDGTIDKYITGNYKNGKKISN